MNTKTKAMIAVILGNAIFGLSFLFSKVSPINLFEFMNK